MNIKVRETKDVTILDIEGRIDINSSELIETIGWLLKNKKLKILCNLENIELVDYSGLSILAIAYKNVTNHNGIMNFYKVGLHIAELFRMVQMDKIFRCYTDEEEGLRSFEGPLLDLEKRPLRRRFKRLEINIQVDFTPLNKKIAGSSRSSTGKLLNVSGAGLFIYTPSIFPIKTPLHLEISLPKEMVPLEMEGLVIWVADKNLQPHCYPGMGIQFVNVNSEKQKELVEFIDRNITHRSET